MANTTRSTYASTNAPTDRSWLYAGLLALLGVILLVVGSHVIGPVYNSVADKSAAVLAHDTVLAIQQNGDTLLYKNYQARKFGADLVKTALGILALAGAVYFAVRGARSRR